MSIQICLLDCALSELFVQATETGQLTLADRYGLLAALLQDKALSDEERAAIDRLLRAASRGRLQIVNQISAVYGEG